MLKQIGAHFVRIGSGFVDFVNRHDHRHFGRLGVVNRFDGLRHHRVIGGNHKHHDIRDIRPTRPHGGKGRVTRRIKEGQKRAAFGAHLIGPDMLRDPACFARDDICLANAVKQRGLAVVNMAHDGDDGWPWLQLGWAVLFDLDHIFHICVRYTLHAVTEFADDQFRRIGIDGLVLRDHHAHLHQRFNHIGHALGHAVGQFGNHDGFWNLHIANDFFAVTLGRHRLLALTLLLAFHGSKAALTPAFAIRENLIDAQLARTAAIIVAITL